MKSNRKVISFNENNCQVSITEKLRLLCKVRIIIVLRKVQYDVVEADIGSNDEAEKPEYENQDILSCAPPEFSLVMPV